MREILFRGKTRYGEWVEFDIIHEIFGDFIQPIEEKYNGYDIIPETIGQYTGLTDCKGNKIFEGDIISVEYEYESYSGTSVFYEYYEVFFHEKYHCWYTRHSTIKTEYWLYGFNNRCEVIGNIYDNPEILGAAQ